MALSFRTEAYVVFKYYVTLGHKIEMLLRNIILPDKLWVFEQG